MFEFEGDHGFGEFATPGAFVRKEEGARDLHGDGAGALIVLAGVAEVGPGGAEDADEVETTVVEEALVFGGENGMDEIGGKVVVTDGAAFLACAVEEVGDEFRLDLRGAEICPATQWTDGADTFGAELYGQGVSTAEVGKLGGTNVDGVVLHSELAEGVFVLFRAITHADEIGGERVKGFRLADGDFFGSRKYLRGVLQDVAGETRGDGMGIFDVVVGEDAGGGEKGGQQHGQNS